MSSVCFPVGMVTQSDFVIYKKWVEGQAASSSQREDAEEDASRRALLQVNDMGEAIREAVATNFMTSAQPVREKRSADEDEDKEDGKKRRRTMRPWWRQQRRKRKQQQHEQVRSKRQKRFPAHSNPMFRGYRFLEKSGECNKSLAQVLVLVTHRKKC